MTSVDLERELGEVELFTIFLTRGTEKRIASALDNGTGSHSVFISDTFVKMDHSRGIFMR